MSGENYDNYAGRPADMGLNVEGTQTKSTSSLGHSVKDSTKKSTEIQKIIPTFDVAHGRNAALLYNTATDGEIAKTMETSTTDGEIAKARDIPTPPLKRSKSTASDSTEVVKLIPTFEVTKGGRGATTTASTIAEAKKSLLFKDPGATTDSSELHQIQ
jgi:hypothetical protein